MHVEKNVCDSLIETLMKIQGKTKDSKNSNLYIMAIGIRQKLASGELATRTYLPPTFHSLFKKEKEKFLRVFAWYQSSPKVLIRYQKTNINERSQFN